MIDRMQAQRFERKYYISERLVPQIREFVSGYLELDEFSVGKHENLYPVHSLYLDSVQLSTYWATVHCEKERFKLRVRYYNDDPQSPLFFEIKRRANECVLKQRAIVHRGCGVRLVNGQLPGLEDLVSSKPHHLATLQRFSYLMQRMNARPMMHIAYEREAWISPKTNAVRVTMDRQVRGEARRDPVFRTVMRQPVFPFTRQIVLELKFTDRFPDWFADLVRHFNLLQTGAPKYCGSIGLIGEQRVVDARSEADQQKLAEVSKYY
jgi:hypothetical protein